MNPIELNLFANRVCAICDEMGIVLRRTAFSPNIKDRLDFSCAVFSATGELVGQAAHIPVHLGSMAYAMAQIIADRDWQSGDMLVLNDPYLGGTHLPDVTLISPVFFASKTPHEGAGSLIGFVANRAHHANIGCDTPGSMPISTDLSEEGLLIAPQLILRAGQLQKPVLTLLGLDSVNALSGDFAAQIGTNNLGAQRLQEFIASMGLAQYKQGMIELNDYAERLAASTLSKIPQGEYHFKDYLDDDGCGNEDIVLDLCLRVDAEEIVLDFSNSADQVTGNLNCPASVAAAAAYYALRCLMPSQTPVCAGSFRRIKLITRPGSIVDAIRPAAVAAGNVETSTRLVDVIFGALAQVLPTQIPAASQGSMNNVAMGHIDKRNNSRWDYYETIAGGIGAGPNHAGLNACHSHMTNTLNTPIESLETHYPLRVRRYALRRGSGGAGMHVGGDGVIREYEFLEDAQFSLLTERRKSQPWGLAKGQAGAKGCNRLNGKALPSKCTLQVKAGDRLEISSPGGGGFGEIPA
ncbi:MAG: 5-oxoprolinase [SAR86 cluster bacterium]|uniref:5-oxoprolinase n=1 Tax=SAR86 cluster bacterium TaxID=2030880 RepID=A0A2A4MQ60_9GAMM|nr:MAG: 5-oxoprolinase [SAR86 cluster bacterium]